MAALAEGKQLCFLPLHRAAFSGPVLSFPSAGEEAGVGGGTWWGEGRTPSFVSVQPELCSLNCDLPLGSLDCELLNWQETITLTRSLIKSRGYSLMPVAYQVGVRDFVGVGGSVLSPITEWAQEYSQSRSLRRL